MRSNIVNRLSVWHYCKNNCLHVFQWFRLTLLLANAAKQKCQLFAISNKIVTYCKGGIGLTGYCLRYRGPHSC